MKHNLNHSIVLSWVILLLFACGGGGGSGGGGGQDGRLYCSAIDPPANVDIALETFFFNLNFNRPVAMVQHPQDDTVWFVVEQGGRILRIEGSDDMVANVVIPNIKVTIMIHSYLYISRQRL